MSDSEMIHRVIKMKNYSINTLVSKADFSLTVDIETLDKMGWEFSEIYENYQECHQSDGIEGLEDMSFEEAKDAVFASTQIRLKVEGYQSNFKTFYTIQSIENGRIISEGDKEKTGDDAETLKDICKILAEMDNYPSGDDYSVDNEDDYQDLFIC